MNTLSELCSRVFGCRHSRMSRAFTLGGRTYQVCCDCGSEFDYSLETMSKSKSKHRRAEVPSQTHAGLRGGHNRAPTLFAKVGDQSFIGQIDGVRVVPVVMNSLFHPLNYICIAYFDGELATAVEAAGRKIDRADDSSRPSARSSLACNAHRGPCGL